jgi:glutaredoxin|tara:strand:+ start:2153 stop:2386 length:234 start_codon:yes stop_codon:yes gene_type:complete
MKNDVVIYSKENCPYCKMAEQLALQHDSFVTYKVLGTHFDAKELMDTFPGARTFPQIIFNGDKIGGYSALVELLGNE